MNTPDTLRAKGFAFEEVENSDLADFLAVKKACFFAYEEQLRGGWNDAAKTERNTNNFRESFGQTCFQKVTLHGETVGFFCYDITEECVDGIAVQLLESARGQGVGSCFLDELTAAADRAGKPTYLKVFLTNPARRLYERYGFVAYEQTADHYLMRREPRAVNG